MLYTFVVEIPMFETAKMEVSKEDIYNPIKQDKNKDGSPRYYSYGTPFFNYGLLPQTWEDPTNCDNEVRGQRSFGCCSQAQVTQVLSYEKPFCATPVREDALRVPFSASLLRV